jgi:hypothetical protein
MSGRAMQQTINVWQVAQRCVEDRQGVLGQAICSTLNGWIRSRSLELLASCSSLVPLHSLVPGEADLAEAILQVEALFKKNSDFDNEDRTTAAAISAFARAEKLCRITNKRLDYYFSTNIGRVDPSIRVIVDKASSYVANILGDFRDFLDQLPKHVTMSGGATSTLPRSKAHPSLKLRRNPIVSARGTPYIKALWSYFNLPGEVRPRVESWNRVMFVPKNYKTKRTIAGEPDGLMPLQLAFDSFAKCQLRKKGQDLSDQRRNQVAAYHGSIDGMLSTIDFSMASDTVSLNVVNLLFPREWAKYLMDIRSTHGLMPDGTLHKYAKLSSMGNGATFAVETLCFYAIARAIGSKRLNVYGDDVTIETELVEPFVRVCRFLGFRTNIDKTFSTGSFRESCGGFYVDGRTVTPVYLRCNKLIPGNIALLVNGLASKQGGVRYVRTIKYLLSLRKIPIVPFNDDLANGIHTSTSYALERGYLQTSSPLSKFGPSIPYFKCLHRLNQPEPLRKQIGAYWLWLWRTNRREVLLEEVVASESTIARSRTVVRKSLWREPQRGAPDLTILELILDQLI